MQHSVAVRHCLRLAGAYLDSPWHPDEQVAKVGGKIFAFLGAPRTPLTIAVKNTEELVDEWRARYPQHIGPGPYLSKTQWNRVRTTGPGAPQDDEVRELIEDSYELVVASLPRARRP